MKAAKLITAFICLLVLSSIASASIPAPLPINGKLVGDNVGNQLVQIKNLRTDEVQEFYTTGSGEYLVDAWNFPSHYIYGDNFEIRIPVCAGMSPTCIKTETYNGQVEIYTLFDLGDTIDCPSCPACECGSCGGGSSGGGVYCTEEKCAEDYPCETCPTCPDPETCPECNVATCEDICVEEICPEVVCEEVVCPECEGVSWTAGLWMLAMAILGGLGGTYFTRNQTLFGNVGIKRYKDKVLHRHPGIRGYHDPMTSHRDKKERHPKGEVNPKFEKVDGVWTFTGGD